ncbi:MAG TPA: ankyrin repeat domain-containing protein [Planctomycetaceae bacterium]|jgi:ankyrin repeat protein|nr:ankyrin repeat domain-containing protein [Planctomycetaceae bacterium]
MTTTITAEEQTKLNDRLLAAARAGDVAAIGLSLNDGADIDVRNDQDTLLHLAVLFGNGGAVKALLEAGATIDAQNTYQNTALHWAASTGHMDSVKALLAAGAKLDVTNEDGNTAIDQAREVGCTVLADYMQSVANDPGKRPIPQEVGLNMAKRNAALVKLGKHSVLGPQTAALKKVDLQRQRSIEKGEGI